MRQIGKQITVTKATVRDILNLHNMWLANETIFGMITCRPPRVTDFGNVFVAKLENKEIIGFAKVSIERVKGIP